MYATDRRQVRGNVCGWVAESGSGATGGAARRLPDAAGCALCRGQSRHALRQWFELLRLEPQRDAPSLLVTELDDGLAVLAVLRDRQHSRDVHRKSRSCLPPPRW